MHGWLELRWHAQEGLGWTLRSVLAASETLGPLVCNLAVGCISIASGAAQKRTHGWTIWILVINMGVFVKRIHLLLITGQLQPSSLIIRIVWLCNLLSTLHNRMLVLVYLLGCDLDLRLLT